MTVALEPSPFVLPPPPENFRVEASGVVTPVAEPPVTVGKPWLEGRIQHFSASSLRLLRICPESYRQRYILGKKERPGEALTVGKAVHEAIGFSHTQKVESHEDLPVAEVVERFHDHSWGEAVEKDGGVDEIRWDKDPEEVRRDGERMTRAYHATVSPRVQPIAKPEMRFDLYIESVPVPFMGYLDVEEETHVTDLKTGNQVKRTPDAHWRMQGAVYSLAKKKPTHFHCVSRAKTPSIATPLTDEAMTIPYRDDIAATTRQVLIEYVEQVEYFMHKFGPDEAWPTTGLFHDYKGGPACNYCGFRRNCPAWAWERTVPA